MGQPGLIDHADGAAPLLQPDRAPGPAVDVHPGKRQ
jgi:hypothetical protein